MKVLENNHGKKQPARFVWCTHCHSKLEITDADIREVEGRNAVLCPCCKTHFPAMTQAETVTAYYQK